MQEHITTLQSETYIFHWFLIYLFMKAFAFSDLNSATAFRNVATSDWSAVSYKLHRFTVVTVKDNLYSAFITL